MSFSGLIFLSPGEESRGTGYPSLSGGRPGKSYPNTKLDSRVHPEDTENLPAPAAIPAQFTTNLGLSIPSTQKWEGRTARQKPETSPAQGKNKTRGQGKGWPGPTEQLETDEGHLQLGYVV